MWRGSLRPDLKGGAKWHRHRNPPSSAMPKSPSSSPGQRPPSCSPYRGLTGACTASEDSSFASPGGATKLSANGFDIVDADTVGVSTTSETDDTSELDHVFTATASQSVTGFCVLNNDDDVVFAECCFAAAIAMENNDTLTVEMKMQFKLGA